MGEPNGAVVHKQLCLITGGFLQHLSLPEASEQWRLLNELSDTRFARRLSFPATCVNKDGDVRKNTCCSKLPLVLTGCTKTNCGTVKTKQLPRTRVRCVNQLLSFFI